MDDETPPRSLLYEFDRLANSQLEGLNRTMEDRLGRYRDFVRLVHELSAGGPPLDDLVKAIDTGSLNSEAVAHLLYGLPFDSWTEPPPDVS